ncbi:MAG: IS21 family transposase [Candidatus Ruthia sp.]|nr:IS21 family transposase [Candidatus Ruthturnera sp.]
MPTKRKSMRKLREVLRLRFHADLSMRQIRNSTQVSLGAIQKVVANAEQQGLDWPTIQSLSDTELTERIYPKHDVPVANHKQLPDWSEVYRELKPKGMTLQLLWEEHVEQYPAHSFSYSQYCRLYRQWLKKQRRSMRQIHKAGEKLFVDYAGQTVRIVSHTSGEVRTAQIFVAVLGASNYTFCEATWSQKLADWINSHVRAFEYIQGVPEMVVPDNLKSGVSKACRYDPDINPSYQQLAAHYGVALVPARPLKPKDKAKAEVGVQIIERWILARLRHHTFFSLSELNHCIKALLEEVNNKPFKQLKGTRKEWFESIDKPVLKPLPLHAYQYTEIKTVKVNIDYHIQHDNHVYSVPHQLVGEKIELHAKENLIELYFHNKRMASHVRKYYPGTTTVPDHMPIRHEKHHQWSSGRLMNWAKDIGDEVLLWVQTLLKQKQHEEQAYRVCLGLLSLSRSYPAERLNKACAIANQNKLYRLKQIKEILRSNQDKLLAEEQKATTAIMPQNHENIRGPESFH